MLKAFYSDRGGIKAFFRFFRFFLATEAVFVQMNLYKDYFEAEQK